jgi:hypothetical protein
MRQLALLREEIQRCTKREKEANSPFVHQMQHFEKETSLSIEALQFSYNQLKKVFEDTAVFYGEEEPIKTTMDVFLNEFRVFYASYEVIVLKIDFLECISRK